MVKNLYLMRHGQTRFNVQKRIQGASDSPLTAEGIAQAQAAHDYFVSQGIQFDKVFSSTQERATDTAEIVSGRTDIIRLKGLKEMDFGAFEGQQEFLNPPIQPKIGYGDYFVTYGGEAATQVRDRMLAIVPTLLTDYEADTVLAVSHGGAVAQFYRNVIANPPQIRMRNCCILHFEVEDGVFDLLSMVDPVSNEVLYDKENGIKEGFQVNY